jgi:hypothetical protein
MSRRLANLKREVALLRNQFLPDPFDHLGVYAEPLKVQAQTRAFLVLSHAEVESYLEEWAKELARAAEDVWTRSRRVAPPLAFLLNWCDERLGAPETLSTPAAVVGQQRLNEVVTIAFRAYFKRIKDNNGVKEKNVLALFAPVGVDASAFPSTLLPNLDDLGTRRGTHAHHSGKSVTSAPDPETEFKRLETVLTDLEPLERWLIDYRRRIR